MNIKSFESNLEIEENIDPNFMQQSAADPACSVWVNASAGTGKTKVLTDRVLRLLLPQADGSQGAEPHKILCLTFTKAGAGEMALRINGVLSRWATVAEGGPQEKNVLFNELRDLLGRAPVQEDIRAARQLFAKVVDAPSGGINIMTIHAFCQSVLGRFPLESGVPPYFNVIEAQDAQKLLSDAQKVILQDVILEPHTPLAEAFQMIARTLNERQFSALLQNILSERRQVEDLIERHFTLEGFYTALCVYCGISPGQVPDEILYEGCKNEVLNYMDLRDCCSILSRQSAKTMQEKADILEGWLSSDIEARVKSFDGYGSAFLTQKGEIRKSLVTKNVEREHPHIPEVLYREAERIRFLQDRMKAAQCCILLKNLFLFSSAVINEYQRLKNQRGVLDFGDLIFKTLELLKQDNLGAGAHSHQSWVLYKLDQGLDHILVDEAQDTNPEQWMIIDALCTEFYAGLGARDETLRTIFVVGDDKQSIYSFQRASPEEFTRMHKSFEQRIKDAQKRWNNVDLDISFRSTASVLKVVDSVFSNRFFNESGFAKKSVKHRSFRIGQAGHVELWPLFEAVEGEKSDPWTPPIDISEYSSADVQCAMHVAQSIHSWLQQKKHLPSRGRSIEPGDIMILVRTRTDFVEHVSNALKSLNIPVSGTDRMILGDHLMVQDLLACASFGLLPSDDLTLACLLKSPLIGLSEEELFDLAHNRSGTLWESVQRSRHVAVSSYLLQMIRQARSQKSYDFFTNILDGPCPADDHSGLRAITGRLGSEILDPLQEFLDLALKHSLENTPVLQTFVHAFQNEQIEIKRELENTDNFVRIMTVHASKGLQAPVVLLPDTICSTLSPPGQNDRRLLWPNQTELPFPLWSPNAALDFDIYKEAAAKTDQRILAEYYRLLYVAMTRAEDHLYVTGYLTKKKPMLQSWYYLAENGMKSLPDVYTDDKGALCISGTQTASPDRESGFAMRAGESQDLPAWIYKSVEAESPKEKPASPSRILVEESTGVSPLGSDTEHRFKKGVLIHKLLEILPDFPLEIRRETAEDYLRQHGKMFSSDVCAGIVSDIFRLLEHPDYCQLFGPGSMAEVSISGVTADGQSISGQIDRLLITDTDIWVVDYKTHQVPPETLTAIPKAYYEQIRIYCDLMRGIYPNHTVHGALLWTSGPELMKVI